MLPIRTILCATDFSSSSEYAFSLAGALARDYKAKLLIVHVKPLPTTMIWEGGYMPPGEEDMQVDSARLAAVQPPAGIDAEHVLIEGVPATEIIRLAQDQHADLIVLGTHGRTGLGRLLMGSVAEMVVRRAPCPVLTIRQPLVQTTTEQETASQPVTI